MPKIWNPEAEKKYVKQHMHFIDWTPESLRETRKKFKLTQKDIAEVVGLTPVSISAIERGDTTSPWAVQLYGIILERYYAGIHGYLPAFRKVGESEFATVSLEGGESHDQESLSLNSNP